MCTLTWLAAEDGFVLSTNRDERHTRADARPPEVHLVDGVRVLAPIDPDGGGSWVTVNEHGLALCLLNAYETPEDRDPALEFVSRGLLVLETGVAADVADALGRLHARRLADYRSFRMVVVDAAGRPSMASWDRRELLVTRPSVLEQPLISSPLFYADAVRARRAEFARIGGEAASAAALDAFHRSHEPERGSLSPCMHGELARTRSRTRVVVAAGSVAMAYTDGSPCETAESAAVRLPRVGR